MIHYSTNWMGPVSSDWYKQRGITDRCCAGRIDIRGVPDEPWGLEYGLPPMLAESWGWLSDWLDDFESETLLEFDELIARFERETGHKIMWIQEED